MLSHDIKVLQTKQGGWRCAGETAPGKGVPALGSRWAWLRVGDRQDQGGPASVSPSACRQTASRRAADSLGKNSRNETGGSKNPREGRGKLNPISWADLALSECCRAGKRCCCAPSWLTSVRPAATSSGPSLSPTPTLPASQGWPTRGHISASSQGMLQEPLPLDAFCSPVPQRPSHTYTGHIVLPNTPHPTHAKVLLDTHLCHRLKHPLVTQRHLLD